MQTSWTCKKCNNTNPSSNRKCLKCGNDFHSQLSTYPDPNLDNRGTPSFTASDLANTVLGAGIVMLDVANAVLDTVVTTTSDVCSTITDICD